MTAPCQIIAMGGGGFSSEPDNLALDRYILAQARREEPRILFVPTAGGDTDSSIARFYAAYSGLSCQPSHLPLFRTRGSIRDAVLQSDIIHVGGGNTQSMLAIWREWDLPQLIRQAYEDGCVLSGWSAGAICWFEQGVTDSIPGDLTVLDCLGMLPGSCCPHYDGEKNRRPSYERMLREGAITAGVALDDGAAAHYVDGVLQGVATSRPAARGYQVMWDAQQAKIVETEIQPLLPQKAFAPTWPTW